MHSYMHYRVHKNIFRFVLIPTIKYVITRSTIYVYRVFRKVIPSEKLWNDCNRL